MIYCLCRKSNVTHTKYLPIWGYLFRVHPDSRFVTIWRATADSPDSFSEQPCQLTVSDQKAEGHPSVNGHQRAGETERQAALATVGLNVNPHRLKAWLSDSPQNGLPSMKVVDFEVEVGSSQ